MRFWAPCLSVLALSVFGAAPQAGDKKVQDYYPLRVGNTWTFQLDLNGKKSQFVTKISKTEMVDGVETFVLEGSTDGKVIATEHLRQSEKGVVRHKYGGSALQPPFVLLPYPAKAGDKWEGQFRLGVDKAKFTSSSKEEAVEVPAGSFKALRVDIDVVEKGDKAAISYWFAEGTGMVKQRIRTGKVEIELQLEKFERGK